MRYSRHFVLISALFLFLSGLVLDVSAQTRTVTTVQRPVIVRHWSPYRSWYGNRWYDPWYDPYFYDPYLMEQRERYYKEKAVKDTSRKLNKDKEKFGSDGVITAKEQKKLEDRIKDHNKAVQKLDRYNNDSD